MWRDHKVAHAGARENAVGYSGTALTVSTAVHATYVPWGRLVSTFVLCKYTKEKGVKADAGLYWYIGASVARIAPGRIWVGE